MTVDTSALQARITFANQPTYAQALIADLWAALSETLGELAAAQQALAAGQGDAQLIADLRAQVLDLTGKLTAAQSIATAEESQIAQMMADDSAKILDLQTRNAALASANQQAATDLATAQQQAAASAAAALTANQALAGVQSQLTTAKAQLTQDVIDKNALQATIDALKLQLAGQTPAPPPQPNVNPVWAKQPPPIIGFTVGFPAEFSFAGFATDANGDPVSYFFNGTLPAGITVNLVAQKFIYDGKGPAGSSQNDFLVADDGKP